MLFEIRNYTSNILYIKRIKTLVFNYLYYIYRGYNNCLCTSVFGGYGKCNAPTLYELQIFILCNCVLCITFVNSDCKLQM